MSDAETIAKNTVFLSIGEVGTRVLSFLLLVVIARRLGDVGLGAFAFAFAFADLLLNFLDLGVPMYMTREIAKNKESTSKYLSTVLGLRLAIVPVMLLIGLAFALLINANTSQTRLIIVLATAGTALNFIADPLRVAFIAHERSAYYSLLIMLERLVFTGAAMALLATGHGLVEVLSAFVIAQLVSLVTTVYVVRRKLAMFTATFDKAAITAIVKHSAIFWLGNLFRMIYQRIDTIMLSAMQGFAVTGWYNAAYRMTEALRVIPLVMTAAVYPAISRIHTQSKDSVKVLYEKSFYYLLAAALPIAAGLTLVAGKVITFLYGPAFSNSIIVLKLLVWAEALMFLHLMMGMLLNAIGKQHLFTITTAIYAVTNVVLNLIMIPKYGHIGAATAAIITQVIAVLMLYHFCARNGYGLNLLKLAYKPIIAVSVMSVVLIASKNMHLLVAAPAAAAAYIAMLAMIKGIGKEELVLIRKVLRLS